MIDIVVFNVRLGQCVFFHPHEDPKYSMMVDCGHDGDFHPIDTLVKYDVLPVNTKGLYEIGNLTLTNYDHDHFSGLPYITSKAKFRTVTLAKNITVDELVSMKYQYTDALDKLVKLRETYTNDAQDYTPPYTKTTFTLTQPELISAGIEPSTNHLSRMVFVEVANVVICIPGDLEEKSWELMLRKQKVRDLLERTDIFFASHHGRRNGYYRDVFNYCFPECIIISDKEVVHGTQEGMAGIYGPHVIGDGIILKRPSGNVRRKVITTRNDGHIHISIDAAGNVAYQTLEA